ncbi:MAG: GNAT family N-acetyltransferase [Evtepia sp.]|uniref:GNAT family N-acetyltransferase n=1 Tax=Evtepia sp. TaxID=2773933 RepID=UPI002A754280|nr:GNAT family N-acetyltransferase [Evtepia sp.]MDY3013601.1 GNAT family N-acetyltransferase [Evtepia sp.]
MYTIKETQDFHPLSILYQESGLEVKPSQEPPAGTEKLWRCEENGTGDLLAAATLQKRSGYFVLAHLAVCEPWRGRGLGKILLALAEEEAKARGAQEIWLVGKVPEFYAQYQWETVPREEAPAISRCLTCDQFQASCFPSIMKKRL